MTLGGFADAVNIDRAILRRLLPLIGPWYLLKAMEAQNIEPEEAKARLGKAISALQEEERLMLSIYYVEELTIKELSVVFSTTEQCVYATLDSAFLNLLRQLRQMPETGSLEQGND